jgi:hypothetical protein
MKEKISPTARDASEFIPMVEWLGLFDCTKKWKERKEVIG